MRTPPLLNLSRSLWCLCRETRAHGAALSVGIAMIFAMCFAPASANAQVELWPRLTVGWHNTYSAESDSARFIYPTFTMAAEAPEAEFEFQTPAAFLFVDGILALVRYLAGNDEGLPLYNALNRSEPSTIHLWTITLRIRIEEQEHMRAMVGLTTGLQLLRFNYPQEYVESETDDTHVGALAGNIGPTFSARFPGELTGGLITLEVGTGLISQSAWNPYVGGVVSGHRHVGERVRLYGNLRYRAQRWDFRDEDSYAPDPDIREMIHFAGFEVGFAFSPPD